MSDGRVVKVERQELYERVWTTPIVRLAAEFGLSGVGLAKLCKREGISVPPRGYWAHVRSGAAVRQPALPRLG